MLVHYLIGSKAGQDVDMHPVAAENALLAGFAREIPGRTELPPALRERLAAQREPVAAQSEPKGRTAAPKSASPKSAPEKNDGRTPSEAALLAAAGEPQGEDEGAEGEGGADSDDQGEGPADFDSIPAAS